MSKQWGPFNTSERWMVEAHLKEIIESKKQYFYNGISPDAVEDIYVDPDGTAEVDVYCKDKNNEKGLYHCILILLENEAFCVQSCQKRF